MPQQGNQLSIQDLDRMLSQCEISASQFHDGWHWKLFFQGTLMDIGRIARPSREDAIETGFYALIAATEFVLEGLY